MSTDVLLIDNFDSFTFNLVDEFARRGCQVKTVRNHASMDQIKQVLKSCNDPLVVLSPGPGKPEDAGVCPSLVQNLAGQFPILGVCLGHQVMVQALGGKVGRAGRIMHGKSSLVSHRKIGIFEGLPNPLQVARYHSLVAHDVPDCFEVTADVEGVVMAIHHKKFPLWGMQFHPESILTPRGGLLIDNIIQMTGDFYA